MRLRSASSRRSSTLALRRLKLRIYGDQRSGKQFWQKPSQSAKQGRLARLRLLSDQQSRLAPVWAAGLSQQAASDQAAAALHIYRTQGPGAWTTISRQRRLILAGPGGAVPPSAPTPGTTLNTPPPSPAASIANALTGGTGANGQGLSPIQQAQQASSGGEGGGQALQPRPRRSWGQATCTMRKWPPKRRN